MERSCQTHSKPECSRPCPFYSFRLGNVMVSTSCRVCKKTTPPPSLATKWPKIQNQKLVLLWARQHHRTNPPAEEPTRRPLALPVPPCAVFCPFVMYHHYRKFSPLREALTGFVLWLRLDLNQRPLQMSIWLSALPWLSYGAMLFSCVPYIHCTYIHTIDIHKDIR